MLTLTQDVPMLKVRPVPATHKDDIRFKHVEDLRAALEEYGAFHDGTIVRKYGAPTPHGAGPRTRARLARVLAGDSRGSCPGPLTFRRCAVRRRTLVGHGVRTIAVTSGGWSRPHHWLNRCGNLVTRALARDARLEDKLRREGVPPPPIRWECGLAQRSTALGG